MSIIRIIAGGLLSVGSLLVCSCSSEDVAIPDSVLVNAHIQSAVIPQFVTFGSPLEISVRIVEGCRLGEWEGAEVRFESRNIYIETRSRVFFDFPPDCVATDESHTVIASFGSGKGSQPLPRGVWDVFVVGRNTTVTGRVTVG
jgi:hypothetical protein